eukprot:COSAG03_NODE_6728_length_1014_cov_1.713661_2_plen_105_part_00
MLCQSVLRVLLRLFVCCSCATDVSHQSAAEAATVEATPAARPPAGWSTWTTFKCDINETLVYEAIDALLSSGLAKSGYDYVLCVATTARSPSPDASYLMVLAAH